MGQDSITQGHGKLPSKLDGDGPRDFFPTNPVLANPTESQVTAGGSRTGLAGRLGGTNSLQRPRVYQAADDSNCSEPTGPPLALVRHANTDTLSSLDVTGPSRLPKKAVLHTRECGGNFLPDTHVQQTDRDFRQRVSGEDHGLVGWLAAPVLGAVALDAKRPNVDARERPARDPAPEPRAIGRARNVKKRPGRRVPNEDGEASSKRSCRYFSFTRAQLKKQLLRQDPRRASGATRPTRAAGSRNELSMQ